MYLLGKPSEAKSIETILVMISRRLVHQVDDALGFADALERDLEGELDNGRVARLMSKLGFINERPEFQMDPRYC
jgi:PAB-dependent poly(A)-specific ribonuclease subunit 3